MGKNFFKSISERYRHKNNFINRVKVGEPTQITSCCLGRGRKKLSYYQIAGR